MLVDNRTFGRLGAPDQTEAQQAKPKCDCVASWHRKAVGCQSQSRDVNVLVHRLVRRARTVAKPRKTQSTLHISRGIMACSNDLRLLSRRRAANAAWQTNAAISPVRAGTRNVAVDRDLPARLRRRRSMRSAQVGAAAHRAPAAASPLAIGVVLRHVGIANIGEPPPAAHRQQW